MAKLTATGEKIVATMAERHGFETEAVRHMIAALARGHGRQAQFAHPAFGGMGQWSQGGMTMIGDMFNDALKGRVSALCRDLSDEMGAGDLIVAETGARGTGWPAGLGAPSAEGAQNDMRYAYFPETRRLAVALGGKTWLYDTGSHRIGGFGQSQGAERGLTLSSQHGTLRLSDLKLVDSGHDSVLDETEEDPGQPRALQGGAMPGTPDDPVLPDDPGGDRPHDPREGAAMPGTPPHAPAPAAPAPAGELSDEQIFARLERLADFHARGILDDGEFAAKKAELLARL
jgi:hypothetical protein